MEVQETIEKPQETGHTSHARVVLTCQEVMDAVSATKPSVSDAERLKFAQMLVSLLLSISNDFLGCFRFDASFFGLFLLNS